MSTPIISSDVVENVKINDITEFAEKLLKKGFTVSHGGDNITIWLKPGQEAPKTLSNQYGFTIGAVESCAEDSEFNTKILLEHMIFVNRAELRHYEHEIKTEQTAEEL